MGFHAAGNLGKAIIIIINIIFSVFGLGLMAIGIVMRINSDELYTDEIIATLNEITFAGNISLGNAIRGLSIYVILLGVFILLVCATGALGACYKSRPLLIAYAIVVGLIFLGSLTAMVLWAIMKEEFEETVGTELFKVLDKYDGGDSTDDVSIGMDLIQLDFKCCGSNDISSTKNSDEFKNSKWHATKRNNGNEKVPPSCCKGATKKNYKTYQNANCQENLVDHQTKGCHAALKEETENYQILVIAVSSVLLVIEVLAFSFTVLLLVAIGKEKMCD